MSSAVDEILEWRAQVEGVRDAAEGALERIDSVLGLIRAAVVGELLTKRQRCDELGNMGVFDSLHGACSGLDEAAEAIYQAARSVLPDEGGGEEEKAGGEEGAGEEATGGDQKKAICEQGPGHEQP